MTVSYVRDGAARGVPGPADLLHVGSGDLVLIAGPASPVEKATWCAALGLAAMRGAEVRRAD
jgi:hypothetical protein